KIEARTQVVGQACVVLVLDELQVAQNCRRARPAGSVGGSNTCRATARRFSCSYQRPTASAVGWRRSRENFPSPPRPCSSASAVSSSPLRASVMTRRARMIPVNAVESTASMALRRNGRGVSDAGGGVGGRPIFLGRAGGRASPPALPTLARVRLQRLSPIGNSRNPPPRAENAANFFRSSARAGGPATRQVKHLILDP